MAILLLAGDIQLNPGPRLASHGDLLPSSGALDFPPALVMPPLASGGAHGGVPVAAGGQQRRMEWPGCFVLAGEWRS